MDENKPRRRKRWPWAIAALVLLTVAYPASNGPAAYLAVCGVISYDTYNSTYRPLSWFFDGPIGIAWGGQDYVGFWVRLAERHSGNKL